MQMSARNLLEGTVKQITTGEVNSEVVLELPGGQEMVSVITTQSVKRLGLEVGKPAKAFVKASNVMLIVDE
jgi:molybdate transport system regulatory protein